MEEKLKQYINTLRQRKERLINQQLIYRRQRATLAAGHIGIQLSETQKTIRELESLFLTADMPVNEYNDNAR